MRGGSAPRSQPPGDALAAPGGVSEYWLADPIALAFHALALARIATSRSPPVGAVVRSAVFPGLEVGVASLFADPS